MGLALHLAPGETVCTPAKHDLPSLGTIFHKLSEEFSPQAWDLGPGESSVLAFAMAIIDALNAWHCGTAIPRDPTPLRQQAGPQ